ncbi:hypothetical protein PT974_04214 [Cladobotryum mycophilum]|uniref:Uncharacterized protein n=1 Tax=Cladobotryum mycophilum TaxID=491253 RepID=A0ABR0SVM3_9HYPO
MAHHRLLHDSTAAIFSPSVARIAASTARDWSYIDNWLASKFPSRSSSLPPFERNPDTLKVLLSLVSLNEAADDQRRLLARADNAALQELNSTNGDVSPDSNRGPPGMTDELLGAIEQSLRKDGSNALDALARLCAEASTAYADPQDLGRTMLRLQGAIYENEQMKSRVEIFERQLQKENEVAEQLLRALQGDEYKPPSDLAKQNLDIQRKIKAMSAQLPDLHDRVANLEASIGSSHPGVDDVAREEQAYLALMARKRELDAQISSFAGLPSDPDAARSELDAMRRQLRGVTARRDAQFEGLVEREGPIKRR